MSDDAPVLITGYPRKKWSMSLKAYDVARALLFGVGGRGYVWRASGTLMAERVNEAEATCTKKWIRDAYSKHCNENDVEDGGQLGRAGALVKSLLPDWIVEEIDSWRSGGTTKAAQDAHKRQLYNSLAPYIEIIISDQVEVRNDAVAGSLSLGVFAKRKLMEGEQIHALQGILTVINANEFYYLNNVYDHSIVQMPLGKQCAARRLHMKQQAMESETQRRLMELQQHAVDLSSQMNTNTTSKLNRTVTQILTGPLSFLNSSCETHRNTYPFLSFDLTSEQKQQLNTDCYYQLIMQWRKCITSRAVNKGEELTIVYASDIQLEAAMKKADDKTRQSHLHRAADMPCSGCKQ